MNKLNERLSKLNSIGIMLILIIYAGLLSVLFVLITPQKNYAVSPAYNHETGYSDLNAYYSIRNIYSYSGGEVLSTLATRYYIFTNISKDNKQDYNASVIRASVSAVTTNKSNYFYNDQQSRQTPLPVSTNLYYSKSQNEAYQIKEVNFEIRYFNADGIDTIKEFKDVMFDVPKSKAKFDDEASVTVGGETFTYYCINTATTADGKISMRITSTDKGTYHIDLQTWIYSSDGKIYPYIGVYGFSEGTSWSTSEESLPRQMDAEYILCSAIIYNDGEVGKINYKVKVSELAKSYN